MFQPLSDEKITSYLNEALLQSISQKSKCISNSAILPSAKGSHLVYFAKDPQEELILVAINISTDQKKNMIHIYPVNINSPFLVENIVLEFTECPYMPGVFAILAYDPTEKPLNNEKNVFLTSILIDELASVPQEQSPIVKFYDINPRKKIGTIKDIKWYPFGTMTLLVLTDTRILIYDFQQNIFDPSFEINLKDQQVVNVSQVTRKDQFEKIGFAQKLNQDDHYLSLGKKLSLYLASNTGSIYMIFPFVSFRVVLDESEAHTLDELRSLTVPFRRQQRAQRMAKVFQDSELKLIPAQNQQQKDKQFNLFTNRPSKTKPEIFKLNPATQKNSSLSDLPGPCQKIELFQPITIGIHTLFLLGQKLKNKQYDLKVMVFSEDPYHHLLNKPTYSRTQNFKIETVGQIKLEQTTDNQKIAFGNNLQLKIPRAINNTELYLVHNNMTCYRISLFGMDKFLRSSEVQKDLRLVDVDVVFESKHKLLTLSANDTSILVLRNLKNQQQKYLYESIPFKSFQLKEKLYKTITETQELFKNLAAKSQKYQVSSGSGKKVNLQEIKESSLTDIEQKIKTFSQDYRKSVEYKIKNIKKLYEHIQSKNQQLKHQENRKAEMIKLVNQAEQNENKIKEIFQKNQKDFKNRAEENIRRRINGASKMLDEFKKRIDKQRKEIEKDQQNLDLMDQCIGQSDGLIDKLQDLKQQLIAKKNQLERELGLRVERLH